MGSIQQTRDQLAALGCIHLKEQVAQEVLDEGKSLACFRNEYLNYRHYCCFLTLIRHERNCKSFHICSCQPKSSCKVMSYGWRFAPCFPQVLLACRFGSDLRYYRRDSHERLHDCSWGLRVVHQMSDRLCCRLLCRHLCQHRLCRLCDEVSRQIVLGVGTHPLEQEDSLLVALLESQEEEAK